MIASAENPKVAEQFDFACAGCRIVVALREDYLPQLEGLRGLVPSLVLATSRMRLTEMNGEQALLAVSRPNPNLVTNQVADIVRFVAGIHRGEPRNGKALRSPPPFSACFAAS